MKTKKEIEREKLKAAVERYLRGSGKITKIDSISDCDVMHYGPFNYDHVSSTNGGPSYKTYQPKSIFSD
jgi:hypothetical protein